MLSQMLCNNLNRLTRTKRYANLLHATSNKIEHFLFCCVAFNKFKTTNTNRASEHVTRRVSWFDLTKKGTPSSLTNLKAAAPCLWGVSRPDYHHGEVRNCDM